MALPYQRREAYAGSPAAIVPVADINQAVQPQYGYGAGHNVVNGLRKALDTTNRDTVLWVRELRRRLFITQAEMATLMQTSAGTISLWESGKGRPNTPEHRETLTRLGAQYQMPPLPEARTVARPHNGPYFPSTLEEEFKAHFGG